MTLSLKTHIYSKGKGGQPRLVRVQPYTRIMAGDGPPVFVQGGVFYSEGGGKIEEDDLPHWLHDEIARMTPGARQEVGLKP